MKKVGLTDELLFNLLEAGLIFVKKVGRFTPSAAGIYLPKELEGFKFRFIMIPVNENESEIIKRGNKLTTNREYFERKRIEKEVMNLKERLDKQEGIKPAEVTSPNQVDKAEKVKIDFGRTG